MEIQQMLFLQEKNNQLTVTGRADGGEPWADAASARRTPTDTAQYSYQAPPDCMFEQPGTVTEMDMGYRKLRMNGLEGVVVDIDPGQPEYIVPRNNTMSRM
jgi:hypothetical protein